MNNTGNNNILKYGGKKNGFTLVELIIVITILAILATIAFISFKNYSGNARDGNRVATLKNIQTGLKLYNVKTGTYPEPEDKVEILSGSTLLIMQGIVGPNTTQIIKLNKEVVDPKDNTHYVYSTSGNKRYYQLGVYLEENNLISYFPKTYASSIDYSKRYFYTIGNKVGILLTDNKIPVSKNSVSSESLDLDTSTDNYTVYFSNDTKNGSTTNQGNNLIEKIIENQKINGNDGSTQTTPTPPTPNNCDVDGFQVLHGQSVTAYEASSVTFGNSCTSEQRSCDNGVLSGSFTFASCSVTGATGTFTLSQTSVDIGTSVSISNNCSTAPTSYTSSNEGVATISGNTITTISAGTTTITPVGGACGDNAGKELTVTIPICTSFTYSAWGACQQNNTRTRTITTQTPNGCTGGTPDVLEESCTYIVTASSIVQNLCTTSGQIYYTDASGVEIGRVNNDGTTHSGHPENLTTTGHIVVCSGNQTGYVLKSVNEGATAVGATTTTTAYGNYYQFGRSDTSWTNGDSSYSYDWKSLGGTDAGSANDWGVSEVNKTTATWANSTEENKTKMRGACPENYHVPSQPEWQAVTTTWGGGTNGTNLSNALKLPLAGHRRWSGGSMRDQGSYGYYWSSSPYSANGYSLYFHSGNVLPSYNTYRAYGLSVRCFKN